MNARTTETRPTWQADPVTSAEAERFRREGMTAAQIRKELRQAFAEADHHGIDCTCCERTGETTRSRYRVGIINAVLYALDRFGPEPDLAVTSAERLDEITWRAAEDALTAAREAIIARAVAELASDRMVTA